MRTSTGAPGTDGSSRPDSTEPTIASPNRPGVPVGRTVCTARNAGSMELQSGSSDGPVSASLRATYRALLARGLEAGEAANLTAFLHGLPSAGFKWSLAEIDSIIQRRLSHAAEVRAAAVAATGTGRTTNRARRTPTPTRRTDRQGSTKVIDKPDS